VTNIMIQLKPWLCSKKSPYWR